MSTDHPQHDPSDETTAPGHTPAPTPAPAPAPIDIDPATLASIEAALTAEHEQAMVVDPMLREFRRAATDCGLPLDIDHVEQVDGKFRVHFTSLSWHQMRRLVNTLRDIADDRPVQVMAGPDGPSLFDMPTPAGPVPAPSTGYGLHIEVPA